MANTIVLGMQWGDEGKGKIVDLICPAFDAVARFQGGHNAGHTVKFGDRHFALHLLPSGILHQGQRCVLGGGMVIAPEALFEEMEKLEAAGVEAGDRLFISNRAHVILPTHVALDRAREEARAGRKIGTTSRGIGPAYQAKAARCGVRTGELGSEDLIDRLRTQYQLFAPQLTNLEAEPTPKPSALEKLCREWGERLAPYLADTALLLNRWIGEGKSLLFEGAQGAFLDLDHGTYPYVTSSSATAGGVSTGTGVAPGRLDGVLGVVKAYTTRVGGGPFPTELEDEMGEHLRERGNEFGTTTGRPRRCGWFDAVAARYAAMVNGVDVLALTKLDVLDEVSEIKICTGYRHGDTVLDDFPAQLDVLEAVEPVYRTVPGWRSSTVGAVELGELPQPARDYISVLEGEIGAPVGLVSSGPRREETILVDRPEVRRLVSDQLERVLERRDAV